MNRNLQFTIFFVSLFGTLQTAIAADVPSVTTCEEMPVVKMNCHVSNANSKFLDCESRVKFCQEGDNTHLYGRELRIAPKLVDHLSIRVQLLQETSFKPDEYTFNSEVNMGESQVTVQLVRPTSETQPIDLEGIIYVTGEFSAPN
jgi:hypothetical protein